MEIILVIDKGYEMPLGKQYAPENLLRGRKITKGYAADLKEAGHKVVMTWGYAHALSQLCDNLFDFTVVIVNCDEAENGGLEELALSAALVRAVKEFGHLRLLAQMKQGQVDQDRKTTKFIALIPSNSRRVRENFVEAGFEVLVIPPKFRDLKRRLRKAVNGASSNPK